MTIRKQDAGVWVKASEELPDDERNENGTPKIIILKCHYPEKYDQYRTMTPNQIKDYFKYTDEEKWEWLKPVTGYLLTEAEMVQIFLEFSEYLIKKGNPDNSMRYNLTQFIQSITNQ